MGKELLEKYSAGELLEAFFIKEAQYRLKEIFELDDETVEKNYKNVAIAFLRYDESILDGEMMDYIVKQVLEQRK